ncbi:MAG: PhnD/SsuA/transferrin family substrate-binding protein [Immundisolibacteraceae bacterium]|nr:PhnD/SsuA/transferrin family substrate-binding protein [Immundisolibacteraceae bacterium]
MTLPLATLAETAAQPRQQTLKLGIYPYSVTTRVLPAWRPLAKYLQQSLEQPVTLVSAPDTRSFTQRAVNGDYFLYLSAPHVAAWLDQQGSANRVRKMTIPAYGRLLTLEQTHYRTLEDLAGRTVATVRQGTYVAELLDFQVAVLNKTKPFTINIEAKPTHAGALRALLNGSVDAAFIAPIPHPHLLDLQAEAAVTVQRTRLSSNGMFLAPVSLGTEHALRMGRLLDTFATDNSAASAVLNTLVPNNPGQFAPIDDEDIARLSPLVNNWRRGLN